MAQRIHLGDAQQIGHQGVGSRASPLAADALLAGKADNVPNHEKIAGQAHSFDDAQFMVHLCPGLARNRREPAGQSLLAQMAQVTLCSVPFRHGEGRQALRGQVGAGIAPLGDAEGIAQRLGEPIKESSHLPGRFEVLLRVGVQQPRTQRFGQGGAVADAGQDVVQPLARPLGIVDVVGRHQSDIQRPGQRDQRRRQLGVGRQVLGLDFDPESFRAKDLPQLGRDIASARVAFSPQRRGDRTPATAREADQSPGMLGQLLQRQVGLALLSGQLPGAEYPAEIGIP